jgi:hypothetical protein
MEPPAIIIVYYNQNPRPKLELSSGRGSIGFDCWQLLTEK